MPESTEMKKGMITIDADKCTLCAFCVDVCPDFVLHSDSDSSSIDVRHSDYCCACGHCVAICPTHAIEHEELPSHRFEELVDTKVLPDHIRALLLSRRSIRAYKKEPVSRENLEQLIEVGIHAGTASNSQTEGFIIIENRDILAELEHMVIKVLWNGGLKYLGSSLGFALARLRYGEEMSRQLRVYHNIIKTRKGAGQLEGMIFRNAPAIIVVHGVRANDQAHANCAIAVRNMEVMAASMGLGTCWAGFLTAAAHMSKRIGISLGIPADRNICGAIMVGHPKHPYKKSIPRKGRDVRWI